MAQRYGDGSLFKRGSVYYFQHFEDGKPRQVSTRSERLDKAKKFRDQLLGKKLRGELNHSAGRVTCGALLDDLVDHSQTAVKETTAKIWKWCIEANVRPFFGHLKAATLTSEHLKEYRAKRKMDGRSDVTSAADLWLTWRAHSIAGETSGRDLTEQICQNQ